MMSPYSAARPVSRMMETERAKLLVMEDRIHQRLVGQDEAVGLVADAVIRARAGVKNPSRPIGSFIFLGPTGVGKTELAKTLAAALEAAGLVETLKAKGPFTVFAPTDEAFAKLPRGTLQSLALVMAGVQGIGMLTLGFVLIRWLGQGSLTLVSQLSITPWFERRRGFVFGLDFWLFGFIRHPGAPHLSRTISGGRKGYNGGRSSLSGLPQAPKSWA